MEVMMIVTLHFFGKFVRVKGIVFGYQSLRVTRPLHPYLRAADNLWNPKFILIPRLSWKTRIPIWKSKLGAGIEISLFGSIILILFGDSHHSNINRLL